MTSKSNGIAPRSSISLCRSVNCLPSQRERYSHEIFVTVPFTLGPPRSAGSPEGLGPLETDYIASLHTTMDESRFLRSDLGPELFPALIIFQLLDSGRLDQVLQRKFLRVLHDLLYLLLMDSNIKFVVMDMYQFRNRVRKFKNTQIHRAFQGSRGSSATDLRCLDVGNLEIRKSWSFKFRCRASTFPIPFRN